MIRLKFSTILYLSFVFSLSTHYLRATDVLWDAGAGTTAWGSSAGANANWSSDFTPEAAFFERGVIGSDNPSAQLAGIVQITSGIPDVGGIALGLREIDAFGAFVNPQPAAGTLTGQLTISGGTANSVTTGQAVFGANGRVLVGVQGRGYLTMTGGTLNTPTLIVAGEDNDSGLGQSLLSLSGNATLNVSNAHQGAPNNVPEVAVNFTTISRNLSIAGPNVNFHTFGRVTLGSTSSYTAVITSPTAHSPISTSNIAVVSGALNVQFSGAGANHSIGQTWDLIDADLAIAGGFNNLGDGGTINVSGLPGPVPLGTAYRVQTIGAPGSGQTMQLAYDRVLVLQVNRDTGEMTVRSPQGGSIGITGYTVRSGKGSLLPGYAGISGTLPTPPDTGWSKPVDNSSQPLNTVNVLTEVKAPDFSPPITDLDFAISSTAVTLGSGFSRTAVGNNVANFGLTGEDLTFEYETLDGFVRGQIEYVGTTFENNLVLRVNPSTGQAFLKNDSLETLVMDGYSITSSTGALDGTSWSGIGGAWEKSPASGSALSETNPVGSITLAPNAQVGLGDIGVFTSEAAQNGLALKFILAQGLGSASSLDGDFDGDGDVDGRDFLVWQRGGSPNQLSAGDLALWQGSFGGGGGGSNPPETEFRIGSIVFDNTAGTAVVAAVPEPTSGILLIMASYGLISCRRRTRVRSLRSAEQLTSQWNSGAASMRNTLILSRIAALAVTLICLASADALAVTQGIPLTNNRFELPGPIGTKTVAFDNLGAPIANIIPGWTFGGPGVETFGDEVPGDSGVEGGGNPGNEMILSTKDGVAYQTATGFTLQAIPTTQQYLFSFDAHEIFAQNDDGTAITLEERTQLKARFYYGAARTTLTELEVVVQGAFSHHEVTIPSNSPLLTAPALGQPIGVEFDTTSIELVGFSLRSWAGVDNVIMQIAGVLEGDLDGDGVVNLTDYRRIRDNLEEAHDFLADGDVNMDGLVDLRDFRQWKSLPAVVSSGVLAQIAAIPEPSTVALCLGVVVLGALGRRRESGRRTQLLLFAFLALGVNFGSGTAARAALLSYDPFLIGPNPSAGEYLEGTLGGVGGTPAAQNPTIAGFTDPWDIASADATLGGTTVQTTGLSFLGAPAAGGSLIANGSSRAFRHLATPFDETTVGTRYISFLVNFGGVGVESTSTDPGAVGHRTVELLQINGGEGSNFRIGYTTFNGNFGGLPPSEAPLNFGPFGQEVLIAGAPSSFLEDGGSTHLVVLKFSLSDQPLMDSVELFLNPTDNDEPIVADASFFNRDITLDRISGPVQFGGAGTSNQFDELRIADTFIDALPDFPLKGDTNGDDLVDMTDYQAIFHHLNLVGQSTLNGDVTGDGRVDLRDVALWRANRTDLGALASSTTEVPEPSTLFVALGLLLGLGLRRR